jgi:hypothetical protein
MKKSDFYNDIKTNVEYLSGLSPDAWYKDGTAIVLQTSKRLVSLSCKRNVVTLYTKIYGEKGETVVTDYNTGYKENMVILTAEKISKFLTI